MNPTQLKFGAPDTVIARYRHWTVQLRPAQATLGALVLIAHEQNQTAFAQLSEPAFSELKTVIEHIETALKQVVDYEKINYLMLMMLDPDVHFHVLPRYREPRTFAGVEFNDVGWPGPPVLAEAPELTSGQSRQLIEHLKTVWPLVHD